MSAISGGGVAVLLPACCRYLRCGRRLGVQFFDRRLYLCSAPSPQGCPPTGVGGNWTGRPGGACHYAWGLPYLNRHEMGYLGQVKLLGFSLSAHRSEDGLVFPGRSFLGL